MQSFSVILFIFFHLLHIVMSAPILLHFRPSHFCLALTVSRKFRVHHSIRFDLIGDLPYSHPYGSGIFPYSLGRNLSCLLIAHFITGARPTEAVHAHRFLPFAFAVSSAVGNESLGVPAYYPLLHRPVQVNRSLLMPQGLRCCPAGCF